MFEEGPQVFTLHWVPQIIFHGRKKKCCFLVQTSPSMEAEKRYWCQGQSGEKRSQGGFPPLGKFLPPTATMATSTGYWEMVCVNCRRTLTVLTQCFIICWWDWLDSLTLVHIYKDAHMRGCFVEILLWGSRISFLKSIFVKIRCHSLECWSSFRGLPGCLVWASKAYPGR